MKHTYYNASFFGIKPFKGIIIKGNRKGGKVKRYIIKLTNLKNIDDIDIFLPNDFKLKDGRVLENYAICDIMKYAVLFYKPFNEKPQKTIIAVRLNNLPDWLVKKLGHKIIFTKEYYEKHDKKAKLKA